MDKNKPIEPYIEIDGGYACCPNDYTEIFPYQNCPKCGQSIDWEWFKKGDNNEENKS